MKKIMAVILNYNSYDDSVKCATLLKEQIDVNLYITIVDNNSSDGTSNKLEQYCKDNDIIFIKNSQNKGFSAGNNIGLKKASEIGCQYALIINPDVEIRDEKYLFNALEVMENDKNIAVLGTDIINAKGQHQNPMREVRYWEEVLWPIVLVRNKIRKSLPYICNYKESAYCEKLSGCCFIMNMEFVEEIGYLDDTVFMYSEEPILASMVANKGKKEYFLSSLTAYHMHREAEKGDPSQRLKMFFKSRKYYLKKYSGYGKIRLAIAFFSMNIQEKVCTKKHK